MRPSVLSSLCAKVPRACRGGGSRHHGSSFQGTLDCAVNVASDLKSRSLWDVAKHTTMAPLGMYWSGPMWGYNQDFWADLPMADRKIFFDTHARALAELYVGYNAAIDEALAEAKDHGVTVYEPGNATLTFTPSSGALIREFSEGEHRATVVAWRIDESRQFARSYSWTFNVL